MNEFSHLAELIADEEKGAVSVAIAGRIGEIKGRPDAPMRARIYAAAQMIGGAELMAELEGHAAAAAQLRRLADRLDAAAAPMN